MNAIVGEGNWLRLKVKLRRQLARLNDDGLDAFLARLEMLAGRVQPSRGLSAGEAERQVHEWQRMFAGIDTGEAADVDDRVATETRQRR